MSALPRIGLRYFAKVWVIHRIIKNKLCVALIPSSEENNKQTILF